MKFRNPETGEMFDNIDKAREYYCNNNGITCDHCKFSFDHNMLDIPCAQYCKRLPEEAAYLMGYEVVEDEPSGDSGELKEANMDKPRICEILRVEPGETFYIKGFDGVLFWIMDDGTFTTQPNNAPGSASALLRTLDHPDRIIRKSRFTKQEVNLATVLMEFREDDTVTIGKQVNGPVWWRAKSGEHGIFPSELFPSIQPGQSYTLDEIIGGAE